MSQVSVRVAWPEQGDQARSQLMGLVRDLAGFADDTRRLGSGSFIRSTGAGSAGQSASSTV